MAGGHRYIDMAFRWAHAADPAAKLFYNDGCAEGGEPKAATVYELLKSKRSRLREEVLKALEKMGAKAAGAVPHLRELLKEKSSAMRARSVNH